MLLLLKILCGHGARVLRSRFKSVTKFVVEHRCGRIIHRVYCDDEVIVTGVDLKASGLTCAYHCVHGVVSICGCCRKSQQRLRNAVAKFYYSLRAANGIDFKKAGL